MFRILKVVTIDAFILIITCIVNATTTERSLDKYNVANFGAKGDGKTLDTSSETSEP